MQRRCVEAGAAVRGRSPMLPLHSLACLAAKNVEAAVIASAGEVALPIECLQYRPRNQTQHSLHRTEALHQLRDTLNLDIGEIAKLGGSCLYRHSRFMHRRPWDPQIYASRIYLVSQSRSTGSVELPTHNRGLLRQQPRKDLVACSY